jgi:hypothetical protein
LEKKRFHTFITNYTCLTREEANLLILLEKEFPYSQVVHSLAARATQDNQMVEKDEQLHLGAIYTADRAIFKSIMTEPAQERKSELSESILIDTPEAVVIEVIEKIQVKSETVIQPSVEIVTAQETIEEEHLVITKPFTTISDDSFYDEIQHDLDRLKELKHAFEESLKQLESGVLPSTYIGSDEPLKKKVKQVDPGDELLTEIKSSKKKVKLEGVKQKEQIEIIEQFIKTQPTIKGKVAIDEKTLPKDDLSEKNLTYNENIISETLAEILIKQGKKDKAIEVLKKLIWKFPQKKAYFAAQIEDLKK